MVKIPIEIITYILDFVTYRDAKRFAIASRSDPIHSYLEARLRSTFITCMRGIEKIYYKIEKIHNRYISNRDGVTYTLYFDNCNCLNIHNYKLNVKGICDVWMNEDYVSYSNRRVSNLYGNIYHNAIKIEICKSLIHRWESCYISSIRYNNDIYYDK